MYHVPGPITTRLLELVEPDAPAWSPIRASYCRPLTAAGDGWALSGRRTSSPAGRDHESASGPAVATTGLPGVLIHA